MTSDLVSNVTYNATTAIVLVQPPTPTPGDEGGQGEDFGKSSPVGFVVLLVFFIAVIFLVRSMNKHLRRVPQSFEPQSFEPQSFEPPAQPAQPPPPAGEKAPENKNTETR